MIIQDGHWYRSKQALARIAELACVDKPHRTPDGSAVMVCDLGGSSLQPVKDGAPVRTRRDPALVVQAEHGHDLMHLTKDNGQPVVRRVEFALDALGDLDALVEYDHLPESRKDYSVFPRGHKLT